MPRELLSKKILYRHCLLYSCSNPENRDRIDRQIGNESLPADVIGKIIRTKYLIDESEY